jgi:hypothetical protein
MPFAAALGARLSVMFQNEDLFFDDKDDALNALNQKEKMTLETEKNGYHLRMRMTFRIWRFAWPRTPFPPSSALKTVPAFQLPLPLLSFLSPPSPSTTATAAPAITTFAPFCDPLLLCDDQRAMHNESVLRLRRP